MRYTDYQADPETEALLVKETPVAWAAVRYGEACWLSDRPEPEPEPPFPSEEDVAWWARESARMEGEDLEWLAAHRRALDEIEAALADDGRVTDHDMARSGSVG